MWLKLSYPTGHMLGHQHSDYHAAKYDCFNTLSVRDVQHIFTDNLCISIFYT